MSAFFSKFETILYYNMCWFLDILGQPLLPGSDSAYGYGVNKEENCKYVEMQSWY